MWGINIGIITLTQLENKYVLIKILLPKRQINPFQKTNLFTPCLDTSLFNNIKILKPSYTHTKICMGTSKSNIWMYNNYRPIKVDKNSIPQKCIINIDQSKLTRTVPHMNSLFLMKEVFQEDFKYCIFFNNQRENPSWSNYWPK